MTTGPSRFRVWMFRILSVAVSVAVTLALCEVALRVVFRDGGRTTLGGPGGREFEYTYSDGKSLRGPLATGAKAPGVTRLMVMGDSITWGQGVRDWEQTYPACLLRALNAGGPRYDMAVYAYPGKEIDNHLVTIAKSIAEVSPDIVVYQWFSNDVEISKDGRPRNRRAWRSWRLHDSLRAWSYLYFILDFSLDRALPGSERSYAQYLDQDFGPGTPGWTTFARTFHDWAAHATGYANRTIVMLYPVVPLTQVVDLRHRMAALAAGGQVLSVLPSELAHEIGDLIGSEAVSAKAGAGPGALATTPRRAFAHGDYTASFQVRLDAAAVGPVARVRAVANNGQTTLASLDVDAAAFPVVGAWHTVALPLAITDRVVEGVTLVVDFLGQGALSVGHIDVPVTYGIEVLDLATPLEHVNTAASLFDAHPNAATHAIMCDALAALILSRPAGQAVRP
ncbi:MAG: hypothetical protein ABI880_02320 [Acidobacteriota bacterium]